MASVIGIAGGTAGGKSTFADRLERGLAGKKVCVIHMDSYFKKASDMPKAVSHISGRVYEDHNCPDTIDWTAFHARFDEAVSSDGCDVVIAEGLLVLWDEYIRDRLDIKVFVDCRADERIVRRIRRNMQWGLTFDEITDVYLDMVRFRHDQYVEPTKWTADFIVNGTGNTDMICEMLIRQIG